MEGLKTFDWVCGKHGKIEKVTGSQDDGLWRGRKHLAGYAKSPANQNRHRLSGMTMGMVALPTEIGCWLRELQIPRLRSGMTKERTAVPLAVAAGLRRSRSHVYFPGDSCGRSATRPVHRALAAYKVGPTVMPAETILLSHTWYSLSSMLRVMGWAGTSELLE